MTQTYQSLQPDYQAGLLAEILAVQRAAANGSGSAIGNIPSFKSSPPTFMPASTDVWINSLWFISLILSLLTTFLAVLAKQWLYQYIVITSGTPRARALVRQARTSGLHDWQVPTLIGFLPIILHISVALFLSGVIILLRSILPYTAWFAVTAAGTVYTGYIVSNILPIIYPRCPYRTALTPRIYQLYNLLPSFPRLRIVLSPLKDTEASVRGHRSYFSRLQDLRLSRNLAIKDALWKDAERSDALSTKGVLEATAISWLYTSSYNPTAQQVVLEAFAGLDPDYDQYEGHWDVEVIPRMLEDLQRGCTRLSSTVLGLPVHEEETDRRLELYLRALIQIQPFCADLFQKNSFDQLQLPSGVENYWNRDKCGPRLRTLLTCGLYDVNGVHFWKRFLEDVYAAPNGTELTPGMWVALLRRQASYHRLYSLSLTSQIMIMLREVGFFASTHAPNSIPSMTIDKPSQAMRVAMWECVSRYAEIEGASSGAPTSIRDVLRVLLGTMVKEREWHPWNRTESLDDVRGSISLILDCILQSVNNQPGAIAVWTPNETNLLMTFMASELFRVPNRSLNLISTSPILRNIYGKTLELVERLVIPSNPLACDVLPLDELLRYALKTCLDLHGAPDHSIGERQRGEVLVCWAFDQRHESAYENVLTMDIIPTLYKIWDRENLSVPLFVQHFLAGIPTEKERSLANPSTLPRYVDRLIEYICQPDNLYFLCRILLRAADCQGTLVRLLALKPQHHAWVPCLVAVKQNYNSSLDYYTVTKKTGHLEDVLAVQDILNIHANNSVLDSQSLEALALDFRGMKVPSDNKVSLLSSYFLYELMRVKILVAYQDSLRKKTVEESSGLNCLWRDRLRNLSPSHRKKGSEPDLELNQI